MSILFRRIFLLEIFFLLAFTLHLYAQTVKIKFIETSDVHGAIFPYDLVNDTTTNSSLAQVLTYVNGEREQADQNVVLLDNGDILQGDPVVYYYNFEKPDTIHILSQVMNYMKYDAGTVGNHDIEAGHPVYDKFETELSFPWLAANVTNTTSGEPYYKPYAVTEKEGVIIVIFGMITPAIPQWLPEKIWEGIEFEDMIETAKRWVPLIKEKEHPDLLVGLFHSGVEYTYNSETAETYRNENASKLVAEQVPGFDIVFVGHDHHGWNFRMADAAGDSVLILGTKSRAGDMAIADVTLNYDSTSSTWQKKISGEIVQTSDYLPDPDFMKKFGHGFEEVKEYVSDPIGTFTNTISSKESIFGPSAFVDLIQSIQLELTGADISFAAPLLFNAEIKKGKVYVRDMFNLYKYVNLLYTMNLSGQEIKDYLEYSYGQWFNRMKDENDHLLNFRTDNAGNVIEFDDHLLLKVPYYNFSSAAGINYTVDVSNPTGERISIISLSDGKRFDLNDVYKVALNSYRGNGGGGHLTRGAGLPREGLSKRVINSTEKDLRFYLMKWIEKKGSVTPAVIGNWKLTPEDWWEKGRVKDYQLLFGSGVPKSNEAVEQNKY